MALLPSEAGAAPPLSLLPKRQVENELHTSDAAYVSFCGSLAAEYMLGNQWGV